MNNRLFKELVAIQMKHNPQTEVGAAIVVLELINALKNPTDEMLVEMEEAADCLSCFKPREESPSYHAWTAAIKTLSGDKDG